MFILDNVEIVPQSICCHFEIENSGETQLTNLDIDDMTDPGFDTLLKISNIELITLENFNIRDSYLNFKIIESNDMSKIVLNNF